MTQPDEEADGGRECVHGAQRCGRCFWRVMDVFVRPVLADGDTPEQRVRKKAFVSMIVCVVTAAVPAQGYANVKHGFRDHIMNYSVICMVACFVAAYLWLLRVRHVSDRFVAVVVAVGGLNVFAMDLYFVSAIKGRAWPLFVVLVDLLLVSNMTEAAPLVASIAALWIMFTAVENGYRYGLFDIPGLMPYDERAEATACEHPPCRRDWLNETAVALVTVVVGFAATRSFAMQLQRKEAELQEAVDTAGAISEHFAAYDLDTADECLRLHAHKLPADMRTVFRDLSANLRAYRPYLPDALFGRADQGTDTEEDDSIKGSWKSLASSISTEPGVGSDHPTGFLGVPGMEGAAPLSRANSVHSTSSVLKAGVRRVTRALNAQNAVELKSMSLLSFALPAAEAALRASADAFGALHTAALCAAITGVKAHRGSLDHFNGDRIYASFNAFNRSAQHALNAVHAAEAAMAEFMTERSNGQLLCSVVTGVAHVGHLGTAFLRSPCVVGALPARLELALRAGYAVDEPVVCCEATTRDVLGMQPMRMLLHRFRADGLEGTLHAPESKLAMSASTARRGPQEWMYELDTDMTWWAEYNTAAGLLHAQGSEAAQEHLRNAGIAQEMVERFAAASAQASVLDLRIQRLPATAVIPAWQELAGADVENV